MIRSSKKSTIKRDFDIRGRNLNEEDDRKEQNVQV